MKKLLIFIALILVSGCQIAGLASPIVTGVIAWKDGEASKYYNEEEDILYRSTLMALKDLDIPVTKAEHGRRGGYFIQAGDRNRFKIKIENIQVKITRISIRVNFMGDKPFAELIYQHIDQNGDVIEFVNGRPANRNLPAR